jgi:type II secretory pathway pseudopilin PulG
MKGQSLIEILLAMGISLILLTITAVSIITALGNTQKSSSRNVATTYARQSIEIMRQMRDSNWPEFSNLSGTYCMAENCTNIGGGSCGAAASCGKNIDGIYSRKIDIEQDSNSCKIQGVFSTKGTQRKGTLATVYVSWNDPTCSGATLCKEVRLNGCFADLQDDLNF